jgi:ribosomal protein L35
MAMKKLRSKSHGGLTKRVRKTPSGKLISKRTNVAHRMIKKPRERVLRAKKKTVLSPAHKKFLSVI